MDRFKVIVPCKPRKHGRRWITAVSYPASGCSLYTREEAVAVLRRFYARRQWPEGGEWECWAEGERERFTLHFPDLLVG